jgi:hypothetical protein
MTTAVLDNPRAVKIHSGPLGRLVGILLWGAVVVLVLYPLLMFYCRPLTGVSRWPSPQTFRSLERTAPPLRAEHVAPRCFGEPAQLDDRVCARAAGGAIPARALDRSDDECPFTPPFLAPLAWSLAVGPKGYFGRIGFLGRELEQVVFSFWGSRC